MHLRSAFHLIPRRWRAHEQQGAILTGYGEVAALLTGRCAAEAWPAYRLYRGLDADPHSSSAGAACGAGCACCGWACGRGPARPVPGTTMAQADDQRHASNHHQQGDADAPGPAAPPPCSGASRKNSAVGWSRRVVSSRRASRRISRARGWSSARMTIARRIGAGIAQVGIAEPAAAAGLVRAPVGHLDLDAMPAQELRHVFDGFHALAAEDLAHRFFPWPAMAAAAAWSGTTRIRPSCAVLATSTRVAGEEPAAGQAARILRAGAVQRIQQPVVGAERAVGTRSRGRARPSARAGGSS